MFKSNPYLTKLIISRQRPMQLISDKAKIDKHRKYDSFGIRNVHYQQAYQTNYSVKRPSSLEKDDKVGELPPKLETK